MDLRCTQCGTYDRAIFDEPCPNCGCDPEDQRAEVLVKPMPTPEPPAPPPTIVRKKDKSANSRRKNPGWIRGGSRRAQSARGPARGERGSDPSTQ